MDVRVGVAPATMLAETVEPTVLVSILPVFAGVVLPQRVTPTRRLSVGRSSLSAIPNPALIGGAFLANAA